MISKLCFTGVLAEDRPACNMQHEEPMEVYEWQVLPFGTTCSPCCATYALQHNVKDNQVGQKDVLTSVSQSYYLDNCLQSFTNEEQA